MRVVLLVTRPPASLLSVVATAVATAIDLLAIDSYLAQLPPSPPSLSSRSTYPSLPLGKFPAHDLASWKIMDRAHEKNKYDKRMRINSGFEILKR